MADTLSSVVIRMARRGDLAGWRTLAREMEPLFGAAMADEPGFISFAERRIAEHQAVVACDRVAAMRVVGAIAFSQEKRTIDWLAVTERSRGRNAGSRLLTVALRQLGPDGPVEVVTFRPRSGDPNAAVAAMTVRFYERNGFAVVDPAYVHLAMPRTLMRRPGDSGARRGGSFHTRYERFARWTDPAACPVCRNEPAPAGYVTIAELESGWLGASEEAQGRLWGKCEFLSREHHVDLHRMPAASLSAFMTDLQRCALALEAVSGATHVNYEIHGNSMPHLHAHLFPRYPDDDFPGTCINYALTDPPAYADRREFEFFVNAVRAKLR